MVTIVIGQYLVYLIIIKCLVNQNCGKIISKFSFVLIVKVMHFSLNIVF